MFLLPFLILLKLFQKFWYANVAIIYNFVVVTVNFFVIIFILLFQTKDTDNRVALYDVLKAKKVEDLHHADFDEEVKRRQQVRVLLR